MRLDLSLAEFSHKVAEKIDDFLSKRLEALDDDGTSLKDAMAYALLTGGKRSRPLLVFATGMGLGVDEKILVYPAAAIECIHAYSLVHDDMPEMDNDKLRRGMPTVHCKFGPATAMLAGDALQSLAFDILSDPSSGLSTNAALKLIRILSDMAGQKGMCGGQAMDLHYEHKKIALELLYLLHAKKTGALIRAAVMMGACVREDLPSEVLNALDNYAKALGLAFQIRDDVLDVTGDTEVLGKQAGADIAMGKNTFPALLGLDEAQKRASDSCDEALKSLRFIENYGNFSILESFARFAVTRDH